MGGSAWDVAIASSFPNDSNLLDPKYNVTGIFEPYFRQMGYPLLIITKVDTVLNIKTQRFLSNSDQLD